MWSANGGKGEAGHAWYSPVPNCDHSAPIASSPPTHTSRTLGPAAIPRLLHRRPTIPLKSTLEPLWRHRDRPLSFQAASTSRRRRLRQRRRPRGGDRQKSGVLHRLGGHPLHSETKPPTPPGDRPHPRHRKALCWPLPRHNTDRPAPVDASQPSSLGSSASWKPAAWVTKQSIEATAAVPPLSPAATLMISLRSPPEPARDTRRSQPTP